jgi:putative transposase
VQPRRRAEQAFVSVIADAYLAGVSTRRVERLVQQLGVARSARRGLSHPSARRRCLCGRDAGCAGRQVSGGRPHGQGLRHAAVGVDRDGFRESLDLDVVTAEDGAAWLVRPRFGRARGLAGVKLVSSDAHPGLVDAIAATLPERRVATLPNALHA